MMDDVCGTGAKGITFSAEGKLRKGFLFFINLSKSAFVGCWARQPSALKLWHWPGNGWRKSLSKSYAFALLVHFWASEKNKSHEEKS